MILSKSNDQACFSKDYGSVCGNGVVEDGEECDQGKLGKSECCEKCQLTSGSECEVHNILNVVKCRVGKKLVESLKTQFLAFFTIFHVFNV